MDLVDYNLSSRDLISRTVSPETDSDVLVCVADDAVAGNLTL